MPLYLDQRPPFPTPCSGLCINFILNDVLYFAFWFVLFHISKFLRKLNKKLKRAVVEFLKKYKYNLDSFRLYEYNVIAVVFYFLKIKMSE